VDIVLLEATGRLGGVLETVHGDGFMVERSADNFITNVPWALDLCRRIGFEDQLVQTNSAFRQAFVVRDGQLQKIPEGFLIMAPSRLWPVISTPILSWQGKLRLAAEYFVARRTDGGEESLAQFATRRLGRETYQRLVQPLVGGIYTADPHKLSVRATLPRFLDMERDHRSLLRASWRDRAKRHENDPSSSGARYSMFVAARDGLSSLVDAIAAQLPRGSVRLHWPVERLSRSTDGRWSLSAAGDRDEVIHADAVIVTVPAHHATRLLASLDKSLAKLLGRIPHAPCAIVSLGYRREQIGHPLDGFGFVVPIIEDRRILSASFSSVKYPGRAPAGRELIRVFIGGACQPELAELPEDDLQRLASRELTQLLRIQGEPIYHHVSRWPPVMPQYCLGHTELVEDIRSQAAQWTGLELAGNAYHGVGIPSCIDSGQSAAERIFEKLNVPSV
jgi:oxygen-dependent protoporphyrinogen oxidase